jgi:hypothetical protein
MIYMWLTFTGIKYYKLAVEKDRDSIFTRRDRLEFYLNDNCDRLKMFRDSGLVLMETEKRQRWQQFCDNQGGAKVPFGGTVHVCLFKNAASWLTTACLA